MFSKIVCVAALAIVVVNSAPQYGHQQKTATSYSSLTQQTGHGQTLLKSSPIALHSAPSHAQSYSTLSLSPISHSAPVIHAAPVLVQSSHHQEEHYPDAHPQYSFKYGVEDKHTGDIKSQQESRDGDVTKGEYSVHQPDGTILRVTYTVDKHSGFNAVVHREGHATHAAPQKHHY